MFLFFPTTLGVFTAHFCGERGMGCVIRLDAVRVLKRSNEIGVGKLDAPSRGSGDQVRPSVRRYPDSSSPLQDGVNRNIGIFCHGLHGGPAMGDGCVSHDPSINLLSHQVNKTFIAGGARIRPTLIPNLPASPSGRA